MKRVVLMVAPLALLLGALAEKANAGLAITTDGQTAGFGLSTFATGFPTFNSVGPIGIAFPANGGVLVGDFAGNVRLFATDTDGQLASSAAVDQNYGASNSSGMSQSGGNIYMTEATNSQVVQINPTGTFNQLIVNVPIAAVPNLAGITVNPANGHLFVSQHTTGGGSNQVFDIDPISKSTNTFLSGGTYTNQLVFNPSGNILYAATDYAAADSNSVTGFDASSGAIVFGPVFIPNIPNGVALGTGSLAGNLFVNTQTGGIVELNLTTLSQTNITAGGTDGFYIYADPNNNSLLVTEGDSVLRLTAPAGGGFYSGVTPVPEPASMTLFGSAAAGIVGYCWLRRYGATNRMSQNEVP